MPAWSWSRSISGLPCYGPNLEPRHRVLLTGPPGNGKTSLAEALATELAVPFLLTVKGIKLEELLSIPFPLPPLAEQHRIVAKVDELMAICDRLEASLASRGDTCCRLLDALLHEPLEPAKGPHQCVV